jgi:threonyl-tRNA synthetase
MSDYGIDRIVLLTMDIEGGEFAVFGAGEKPAWLDPVDQLVIEVHRDFGDAASLMDRLRIHGFSVDMRDNKDDRVTADCAHLDYAYCIR